MLLKRLIRKSLVLGLLLLIVTGGGYVGYHFWVYHNNPVLLEIYTDCRGMTYPHGKVLDIRLYQSGRLEYDRYPPDELSAHWHFRYWFPRTHVYVTPDQVNEFIELAEQPDFRAAKDEYPPKIPGTDSEFRTFITFNHSGWRKNVVLVDYFGDDGMGDRENYPPSLLALMKKVRSTTHAL